MRSSIENDVTPCVPATAAVATSTTGQQRKKRFPNRWSLRHLIYSSPILNRRRSQNSSGSSSKTTGNHRGHGSGGGGGASSSSNSGGGKDSFDNRQGNSSKDSGDRGASHHVEIHQATSRTSVFTTSTKSAEVTLSMECPLCFAELTAEKFWELTGCGHRACISCLQQYLRVEITESRVCIACPECAEPIHPNEIRGIIDDYSLYEKYEDFMVRRVLAIEPDTRWCPAPDCGFAVIASECASCPKLKCERPGCDSYFCYHCKAEWHPNQTCDAARAQRSPNIRSSSVTYSQDSQHRDDIKPCPRCQVLIVKMDDGSCNHMMCAVCGAEFCWLCMKEISDLHYLSPSGCTFWGKKPWSRKKKILWQLGTLVGAPVGIALVAGITVPAMIIGIPVWVGRKLYTRYKMANKHKRNAAIVGGVIASVMISPILAGLAVGIGVPILLFYVYGVVPVSLCRSGGCGGASSTSSSSSSTSSTSEDSQIVTNRNNDVSSIIEAVNTKVTNPSIGEASLSMASGSQVLRDVDRESASTVALAGSLGTSTGGGCQRLEVQADLVSAQRFSMSSLSESANVSIGDDGVASTRALAGSMLNYKSIGSDSCSCVTQEDCNSERVRFDDNVSFIATSSQAEKTSIGSSCSFRARCTTTPATTTKPTLCRSERICDTLSNDSISIEMTTVQDEKSRKSQVAMLRSQFFHSPIINDSNGKQQSISKSLDDKTIIEVSNETLDNQITNSNEPLTQHSMKGGGSSSSQMRSSASTFALETSKL